MTSRCLHTCHWFWLSLLLLLIGPTRGLSAPVAVADSTRQTYWGPVPARHDSVSTELKDLSRPGWEKAVMVPYHIIGVPFRIVRYAGKQTYYGAEKLGILNFEPAEYPGLLLPGGFYMMPDVAIEALEGFSYGLDFTRPEFFGPDNILFLSTGNSTRQAERISGGMLFVLDGRTELQLGGGSRNIPLTKYYGVGYDSERNDLSYYERYSSWGGFEVDRLLGRSVYLQAGSHFSKVSTQDSGLETHLALSKIHADDLPHGYPGISNGWTFRLGLRRNNANEQGRPNQGGYQKVSAAYFKSSDGQDLEFYTYHVNLETFLPLWFTKRSLALRSFLNRLDNQGGQEIPLSRLLTFSRPDELRGFSDLRFYARGTLGLSAEYRWPVWVLTDRAGAGIDAYLFSDVGQVFDNSHEIALNRFLVTGGGGLRFVNAGGGFVGRVEVGVSREETIFRLKFSQNFQDMTKGLLYGKDPTRKK